MAWHCTFPCALDSGVLPLVAVTKIAWLQICCGRKSPYFETSNVLRNIYILKMCSPACETDVKSLELLPGWLVWDRRCFCFSSLTPSCSRVTCSSELGLGLSALVKKFPLKAHLLPTWSSAAPERGRGAVQHLHGVDALGGQGDTSFLSSVPPPVQLCCLLLTLQNAWWVQTGWWVWGRFLLRDSGAFSVPFPLQIGNSWRAAATGVRGRGCCCAL